MKGCLISGYPFVVGIEIYSSFESQSVAKTGYVPMPNTLTEQFLGGHAIICLGYNDNLYGGVWIMKNSWGSSWGDRGYFYLPYAYLTSNSLAGDLWKITKVTMAARAEKIKKISLLKKLEHSKFSKKY
jgi:C1A family cysteine protease